MARTLKEIISSIPVERQERINARFEELNKEVELSELRSLMGISQAELAERLSMRQPSVSKIESQNDIQVSTLAKYVEALGGKLDLVVNIPGGQKVPLKSAVLAKQRSSARYAAKALPKAKRKRVAVEN